MHMVKNQGKSSIKELKPSLDSKAEAISGYQSQIAELKGVLKAQEAFQKDTERGSWENTRDQASQDLQIEASVVAASQARIEEPERLEAKDAAHKDLESRQLENTRH